MPISAALRQGPHIKVAMVASRWQRVGDLPYPIFWIYSGVLLIALKEEGLWWC